MQILGFQVKKQHLERIWLLSRIDYKIRFYENELGMAWAMMKPLSDMIIYYIVFGFFLKRGIPGFHLYLFLGLIFWNIFSENTGSKISLLRDKKHLYEYSNMNKLEIYASSVLSSFIGLAFNIAIYFIISFIDNLIFNRGWYISWHVLYLPIFFILTYMICLPFTVMLSAIYVAIRDINQIWQVIFNVLFWVSPVVYDSGIYTKYKITLFLHPMAAIIIGVRDSVFNHKNPDPILWLAIIVNIIIYIFIAIFFFNKYGKLAAEKL